METIEFDMEEESKRGKPVFVICSRSNSNRVKNKPFQNINGIPLIEHLVRRCLSVGNYAVIVAVPKSDYSLYKKLKDKINSDYFQVEQGSDCPLERMADVAFKYDIDDIVRVCHDKVFIEKEAFDLLYKRHLETDSDYTISSDFVPGSAFEIISKRVLMECAKRFKNIEHISYVVRYLSKNIQDVPLKQLWNSQHRFLIDYSEDLKMMELLFHSIGNEASLKDAIRFLDQHQWLSRMNKLPRVTIYTCAYNSEKWITKAMGSVASQNIFKDCEYILIDDYSKDHTPILMGKFASIYKNVTFIRNNENKGLASSSNIALSKARGKYIIRLDSDDYFLNEYVIEELVSEIEKTNLDAIYPDNYFGSFNKIQKGSEKHHVGGSIFRTNAANHVKFTDGLRGYEGLDFFVRAKDQLKVGYYNKPLFFYRQHNESLTKNNLDYRKNVYNKIINKNYESNRV